MDEAGGTGLLHADHAHVAVIVLHGCNGRLPCRRHVMSGAACIPNHRGHYALGLRIGIVDDCRLHRRAGGSAISLPGGGLVTENPLRIREANNFWEHQACMCSSTNLNLSSVLFGKGSVSVGQCVKKASRMHLCPTSAVNAWGNATSRACNQMALQTPKQAQSIVHSNYCRTGHNRRGLPDVVPSIAYKRWTGVMSLTHTPKQIDYPWNCPDRNPKPTSCGLSLVLRVGGGMSGSLCLPEKASEVWRPAAS